MDMVGRDACENLLWAGALYRALDQTNTAPSCKTVQAHMVAGRTNESSESRMRLRCDYSDIDNDGMQSITLSTQTFVNSMYGRDCVGRNLGDGGRNVTNVSGS